MKKVNILYRTYRGENPARLAVQTFTLDDKKDSLSISVGSRRARLFGLLVEFNNIDDYDHFELIIESRDLTNDDV